MSSFRIDRQYVSFVTAETQPVYAVHSSTSRKITVSGEISETGDQTDYIERIRAEIIEKARKEAEDKAKEILYKSRAEAETIIDKANQQAEDMIKNAQIRSNVICENAKKTGYAQGQKSAEDEAEFRKSEEAKDFRKLMDKLKCDYASYVDNMRGDIISLVIQIVKKVINIKLEQSDEVLLGLVQEAIERLKQTDTIVIHVSSEDYYRYFAGESFANSFNSGEAKIMVVEEQTYSSGDLVVESEGEMLDCCISRQLKQVEKALTNEGN